MVDSERVAIFNCVKQLKENVLDERVITEIAAAVQDLRKEIVVGSVIHDDVGKIEGFDNTVKSDDSRMPRSKLVQCDFANMDLPRARILNWRSYQALHRVGLWCHRSRPSFDCAIDYTVTTDTQNLHKLEGALIDECSDRRMHWRKLKVALGRHDD